jgi:hypothetical protein
MENCIPAFEDFGCKDNAGTEAAGIFGCMREDMELALHQDTIWVNQAPNIEEIVHKDVNIGLVSTVTSLPHRQIESNRIAYKINFHVLDFGEPEIRSELSRCLP